VRLRSDEGGQAIVLVALFMAVLLGMGALAVDVGSWFQAQRQLQGSVDAGALAGAQDLPLVTGGTVDPARTTAGEFVSQNEGSAAVEYPPLTGDGCTPDNCLAVDGSEPTSGLLAGAISSVFGSITVKAHAQAYVGPPVLIKNLSPVALSSDQYCPPPSPPPPAPGDGCHRTLTFDQDGFPLLDLRSASDAPTPGGITSRSQMQTWVRRGYPDALPVDKYYGETNGTKTGLRGSFPDDGTTRILLPVYDSYDGVTASVHVIGFAAFVIDKDSVTRSTWGFGHHTLTGKFVKFIAEGLPQPAGPGTGTDFGVYVVGLNG
jgi:hypothetical protein